MEGCACVWACWFWVSLLLVCRDVGSLDLWDVVGKFPADDGVGAGIRMR